MFKKIKENNKVELFAYVILASVVAIYVWDLRVPIPHLDDAFISYRYAINFVDGNGLVFNVGERVEGYTNLLWVLLIALSVKFGFAAPVAGHWLCVATGILLLLASYLYTAILLPRPARALAVLSPLLLLSCNSFVLWTSSGLEQGFFAALVTLALTATTLGRAWLSCVICILATLTRPEGALVAALLLNIPWVSALVSHRLSGYRHVLLSMMPAIGFAIFIVLLTLFRWMYYGDIFPNTFHAKVGGIPFQFGMNYVLQFLADGPVFFCAGMILSALVITRYRLGFIVWLVFFAYILSVRGDVFRNGRFFLPVLPVMIAGGVAATYAAWRVSKGFAIFAAALLMASVIVSLYVQVLSGWPPRLDLKFVFKHEFPYSMKRDEHHVHDAWGEEESIKWRLPLIKAEQPSIRLVASVGIGRIAYYGRDIQILDLVGLVDKTVAKSKRGMPKGALLLPGHQRSDPDYVFSRKPDLIDIPKKNANVLLLPSVLDLWNDPRLEGEYYWDERIGAYRRKSL